MEANLPCAPQNRLFSLLSFFAASITAAQAGVTVVASVKPVHSLVAAIMQGVGAPGLIVEGAGSPHGYAMKPSQAAMLEQADIVFWVGPELETFLIKPLATVAAGAEKIELLHTPGLTKLPFRTDGVFGSHNRKTGENHKENQEENHDDDHAHDGDMIDPHIWLDPINARLLGHEIARALAAADPANAATYAANARALGLKLDALTQDIAAELKPLAGKNFIVFHDGYRYFERRFGLKAAGAIALSPEVAPGAARVAAIRNYVAGSGAVCVFAEPQFKPKVIATIMEGANAKSGLLDPLGAELQSGAELYFALIRNMAAAFKSCLGS